MIFLYIDTKKNDISQWMTGQEKTRLFALY
jgi:hypothetical protein